ncbi:uncharacterized protein (DUF302 family) [Gillisia mitskevichiae]|uniref:Uncharacterized protein (DUF302 family) n=1 Tax=Gillisia mitskevichiae TaxID=270921 RepID=A0A495PV56_9FLAO|nr:DUF302 domain-containing protein [Gillisia mitskevichiae]RKS55064.1 uncharacterized protein (DUF302 family) [Gillisia mitskevichiae]
MNYYFNKTVEGNFENVIDKVSKELEKEGFGVLTDIDLKATFKKKLDIDFKNYRILGACNAPYAHKALTAEDKVGTMLPCNVIVQQLKDNSVEIAAVNPLASMQAIDNSELKEIAEEITEKLKKVINNI